MMGIANIATKNDVQGLLLEDNFLNQFFSTIRQDNQNDRTRILYKMQFSRYPVWLLQKRITPN
jgi:hypothetical protein